MPRSRAQDVSPASRLESSSGQPRERTDKVKTPAVSVVIATKDRPDLLRRCLRAVLDQQVDVEFEIIVVNDAGCAVNTVVEGDARVSLVQGAGGGPAAARNLGIARAAGEIVVFTDDDTIPQPGWLQAAVSTLDRFPDVVGIEGRVTSPSFDVLYEHGVRSEGLGNFLTCNIAYRRAALERVGGFDPGFPYPAGEDRDLGYRVQAIGKLRYEPQMVVLHPPRQVGFADVVRRGRFIESEWRLHHRHPQTRPPRWSTRWGPLIRLARRWQQLLIEERVIHRSPRRAARFALMASGQLLMALAVTLRGPSSSRVGGRTAVGEDRRIRIAWIGAEPERGGGVAGCAWFLLEALVGQGCEVDCYASGPHEELLERFALLPGVRLVNFETGWRFDRWYSNHRASKILTGLSFRAWGRRRLASLLLEQHRRQPYDVIYQFSTIEIFGMRGRLDQLPPVIIHPETHMAGELRWVRRERRLAARCEPLWRRVLVEWFLTVRARRQRRDIRLATRVVAISRLFGEQLVDDYGVDPARVTVIRNPIDLVELRPRPYFSVAEPWRIAFVSRMSARKGLDLIVELSHRLADLEGEVILDLVGADTLWSDYRPLLVNLNQRIARYHGSLGRPELVALLGQADLLVQAAKYEPFGLTVGEALAVGVPVVVTDAVGAAEDVATGCCTVVRADDIDALEAGVRSMLDRVRRGEGPEMGRLARAEAERLFSPEDIGEATFKLVSAVRQRTATG
jgi:glycosyltransferase involved in cell wall biosynthesis/GT2 family glycosyltransferase